MATAAASGHAASSLGNTLQALFGAHLHFGLSRLALPGPLRWLSVAPLLLTLAPQFGVILSAHAEGARGPLAGHLPEHALLHQPLDHHLEAPGVPGHVVACDSHGLLQGGQGDAVVYALVLQDSENHLRKGGHPASLGIPRLTSVGAP